MSPILFAIVIDRISKCSCGVEAVQFVGLKVTSPLLAGDVTGFVCISVGNGWIEEQHQH